MTTEQPHLRFSSHVAIALGLLLLLAGGAFLLLSRWPGAQPQPSRLPAAQGAAATTTTLDPRTEVVARLQEILRVRETALRERDASLFDEIYAPDCPCLRSGRAAVARLLEDHAVWRGRSTSLRIEGASRVNERLWEVAAEFGSKAFRIESEGGRLIRLVPGERQRYRFALVRPEAGSAWLLVSASLLEGG